MITAETVNRITRFRGDGVPVVSLYTHADPGQRRAGPTRVASLLDEIRPLAEDPALGRDARLSLRADIDRIAEAARVERLRPGGIAMFSCAARGLFEEVELPRTVRDRIAVDTAPYVRPMLAVLEEYHRTCVAVVDKGSARLWELYQGELHELGEVHDRTLRKPNFAAWFQEPTVRNKADELAKRHYRRVAAELADTFRADGYALLALGGHQHELPGFVDFLPPGLRRRLAGTFSVDPATATTAEVLAQAGALVERYERAQERRLVTEVLERAAAGGPAAVGLPACLWAASVAAVQHLLVEEGAAAPGVVCDACGWLACSGQVCALCGGRVRQAPDVIDDLVQAVIDEGGSVEDIAAGTDLDGRRAAAALRFPPPPDPTAPAT